MTTQPEFSVLHPGEEPDSPDEIPKKQPVIRRIETCEVIIRNNKTATPRKIYKSFDRYRDMPDMPSLPNELVIADQIKKYLTDSNYISLAQATEIENYTDDQLLKLERTGRLNCVTPVPISVYPHPVDEGRRRWIP